MKAHLITSAFGIVVLLFLFSCQKPTTPDPTSPAYKDTGLFYQSHAACDYNGGDTALTTSGWTKVFEENFSTDLSKWNAWTGGANKSELQCYLPANLQISNGNLVITARQETAKGVTSPVDKTQRTFSFTSGRLESKTTFSASAATPRVRMKARIKWPKGYGMSPAFLSYGDHYPIQGQINIFLAHGDQPARYSTNYFYGTTANNNSVRNAFGFVTADMDLTSCYHIYEMEWSKDALAYYLDGNLVETKTTGGYIPDLFGKSQHLSFYLAVDSDIASIAQIQPGTMYVDWVKVFTSN